MEFRNLRKIGSFYHKIYKFSSDNEVIEELGVLEKHFKNSVTVISYGNLTKELLQKFDSEIDSYSNYKELNLKEGDCYIITKEDLLKKSEDKERMEKPVRRITTASTFKQLKPIIKNDKRGWNGEQEGNLWNGTKEQVAKLVGKSPESVQKKRDAYLLINPHFIIPDRCKTIRKNAKKIKMKTDFLWSKKEESLLWSDTSKNLSSKGIINRTHTAINQKRIKWCIKYPDFVIPKLAEFDVPKGCKNMIEDYIYVYQSINRTKEPIVVNETKVEKIKAINPNIWGDDEKALLFTDTDKNLLAKLPKRNLATIYQARREYCLKNPDFVVPAVAKFKVPKGLSNKSEIVAQPVIASVIKPIKAKIQSISTPKATKTKSKALAEFINNLTEKPKKIMFEGFEIQY